MVRKEPQVQRLKKIECHEREDDDEEYWIGCDTCVRWFHYHCVGLTSIPDGFWSCPYCLSH